MIAMTLPGMGERIMLSVGWTGRRRGEGRAMSGGRPRRGAGGGDSGEALYFNVEGLTVYGYFYRGVAEVADLDRIPTVTDLDP